MGLEVVCYSVIHPIYMVGFLVEKNEGFSLDFMYTTELVIVQGYFNACY